MPRKKYYDRYKAHDPEKVKRERREAYLRHKEKERAAHKEWSKRPDVVARRRERQAAWRECNREKVLLQCAKGIIARRTGLRHRDIPVELAEAKVAEMKVNKLLGRKSVDCVGPELRRANSMAATKRWRALNPERRKEHNQTYYAKLKADPKRYQQYLAKQAEWQRRARAKRKSGA